MSERASLGALARRLAAALPHDPDRTSLRKGIRAALVVSVLFAVTLEVVGGQQLATCERAADLVAADIAASDPATIARLRQGAVDTLSAVRDRFAATLYKPTGPTAHDQALSQIVEELSGLLAFVDGAAERLSAVP